MIEENSPGEKFHQKSRIALIELLQLNLKMMETWRRAQADMVGVPLDAHSTMIIMAVVTIKAERLLRTGGLRGLENLATPINTQALRKCNLSSIAATTGLNRELVRRRVAELQRLGLLAREPDGGVTIVGGLLQRSEVSTAVQRQVIAMASTVDRLRSEGILG